MSIKDTPVNQFYVDVFTTAMEGGIGYWSAASEYHWSNDDGSKDLEGFYAVIEDAEDEGHFEESRIDRSMILKGLRLLAQSELPNRPPLVITADSIDEWDFDADSADHVIQLALFGDVIFG